MGNGCNQCGSQSSDRISKLAINTLTKQIVNVQSFTEIDQKMIQTGQIAILLLQKSNYKSFNKGLGAGKFTDTFFPATNQSLGQIGIQVSNWKRIPQVVKKAKFLVGDFDSHDIIKSQPGQSYLLSVISAVAESPFRIRKIFQIPQNISKGIYLLRLHHEGIIRQIVLDDLIPVNKYNQPIFVQPKNGQFWPLLLQKGFAKIFGSYKNIMDGRINQILRAITYSPTFVYPVKSTDQQILWKKLIQANSYNYVCCISSKANQEDSLLSANSFFTFIDVGIVKSNNDFSDDDDIRLVKLKNPYLDSSSWKGTCSQWDTEFWKNRDQRGILRNITKDNGMFLMPWPQFLKRMEFIDIAQINQSFSHNFIQVISNSKNAAYFNINVKLHGTVRITLTQRSWRNGNRIQPSKMRLILSQPYLNNNRKCYRFIQSGSSSSLSQITVRSQLQPGLYLVYAKIEWNQRMEDSLVLQVQSIGLSQIIQTSKIKNSNFLNHVFFDHALKSPGKQYFGDQKHDWILSKLMFQQAGIGYIACHIGQQSDRNVSLKIERKFFEQFGFNLKSPHKGVDPIIKFQLDKQNRELIIIAKTKRGTRQSKVVFPPSIEVLYN